MFAGTALAVDPARVARSSLGLGRRNPAAPGSCGVSGTPDAAVVLHLSQLNERAACVLPPPSQIVLDLESPE